MFTSYAEGYNLRISTIKIGGHQMSLAEVYINRNMKKCQIYIGA